LYSQSLGILEIVLFNIASGIFDEGFDLLHHD
jgi:hypothetical protein